MANTPSERRQQEADLLEAIKSNRLEPGLQAMRRLLELRLARQDQLLRQCQCSEFPAEQARARVYEALLREIAP